MLREQLNLNIAEKKASLKKVQNTNKLEHKIATTLKSNKKTNMNRDKCYLLLNLRSLTISSVSKKTKIVIS